VATLTPVNGSCVGRPVPEAALASDAPAVPVVSDPEDDVSWLAAAGLVPGGTDGGGPPVEGWAVVTTERMAAA
jgi:hypothetical protein